MVEKDFFNPKEAIELFGLSRRKFYRLIKEEKRLGFMAFYGGRKLIIRGAFEKYLEANPEIKEELKNASRKNKDTPLFQYFHAEVRCLLHHLEFWLEL